VIEEARIKRNLEKFTFPRLSGTIFELKAFNKLIEELKSLNLNFEIQDFTFSSFYSRTYPKIAFSSVSLILFLLYLNICMIMSLPIIIILLGILITSVILTRKPEKIQLITKFNSQNILVKIKSKSNEMKNSDRIALFISHMDSKGQRFKIKIRIRIIKIWISSSIILLVIIALKNIVFIGFEIIFYVIGVFPLIMNIFASIMTLLNTSNNTSEGAVDNASGIACNLEMLNHFNLPENRLTNYNMWFLFTGAEECGTMGIRHFINNLKNFDPIKSIVFNFESIANQVHIYPGVVGDHAKEISNLLLNNKRNLPLRHYHKERVLGTHSDGVILGDRGFQGFEFGEIEAYAYMHTPNDTIDKVNTKILKKVCVVLTDALKEHDSNFFKLS
jgi:hypothetical protein